MSPIDERYLARFNRGATLETDVFCAHCGYNLIGLKASQSCPECGRVTDVFASEERNYGPTVILRDPGRFFDAPAAYRERLARAFALMAITGPAMLVVVGGFVVTANVLLGLVAVGLAIMWVHSLGVIVAPRRVAKGSKVDTASEWRVLRTGAAITQPMWVASTLLGVATVLPGVTMPGLVLTAMKILAGVLGLAALAGLTAVMLLVSNLVYWASDSRLAHRCRLVGVQLPFDAAVLGMFTLTGHLPEFARNPREAGHCIVCVIIAAIVTIALLSVVHAGHCLLSLGSFSSWARAQGRSSSFVDRSVSRADSSRLDSTPVPLSSRRQRR